MSASRFSTWHIIGIAVIVGSLMALSLAGGVYLGYQWGRSNGLASALSQHAGGAPISPPAGMPNLPFESGRLRPYLGVEFEMITPELAKAEKLETDEGALVRNVLPGSPAEQAGLKAGDIVTEVGGQPVNAQDTLRQRISTHAPGDEITLKILRDGVENELKVTLGPTPAGSGFRFEVPPDEMQPGFHFRFGPSAPEATPSSPTY